MTDRQEPRPDEASGAGYGRREFLGRTGKVVAGAALAGSLTGVAQAAVARNSQDAAAKTLQVWYLTGSPQELKYVTGISNRFGRKFKQPVKVTPYDFDPMNRALPLALSAKRGPDVAYVDGGKDNLGLYTKQKWTVDLNPYVKKFGWDKRFSQSVMNYYPVICCGGPNPRSGIPFDLAAVGLFYNPTILAKYNLKVPTTFAQMESVFAALKAKGVTPLAEGGLTVADPGALHYVVQQIAHLIVPRTAILGLTLNNPKVRWDTPQWIETLTIAQNWIKKGYLEDNALATSGDDADALFLNGSTAMTINGTWKTQQYLAATGFQPRFFAMPKVNLKRPLVIGGYGPNNMWIISKYAHDQAAAANYLDYMLGESAALTLWNNADIPAFRFKKVPKATNPVQADIYAAMQKAQTGFFLGGSGFFHTQYKPTLEKLFSLSSSPQAVAKELQSNYERTLSGG